MSLLRMAQEAGLDPKRTSSTEGGEYHSPCPDCGGDDRFSIQPMKQQNNCVGFYACRKCGIGGDSISFAMKFLKLAFKEAAEYVGADISDNKYPSPSKGPSGGDYRPTSREYIRSKMEEAGTPIDREEAQEGLELPKSSASRWVNEANAFIYRSQDAIWDEKEVLDMLSKRGITPEAIKKYKIGWNPTDLYIDKKEWSLANSDNKKLWLPAGIVIPAISTLSDVQRIKIRRVSWKPTDKMGKYIAISGSKSGLTIVGSPKRAQMVVVESELDAYALHYRISSIAFVVAVGSNIKNPDPICKYYAQNRKLFICTDNDDGGQAMWNKWSQAFPHAERLNPPTGKDLGESIEAGLMIREWLLLYRWTESSDLELITYIVKYIQERTITRKTYFKWEKEILLGPESPRAQTGELQKGYILAKRLIEGKKIKCT